MHMQVHCCSEGMELFKLRSLFLQFVQCFLPCFVFCGEDIGDRIVKGTEVGWVDGFILLFNSSEVFKVARSPDIEEQSCDILRGKEGGRRPGPGLESGGLLLWCFFF